MHTSISEFFCTVCTMNSTIKDILGKNVTSKLVWSVHSLQREEINATHMESHRECHQTVSDASDESDYPLFTSSLPHNPPKLSSTNHKTEVGKSNGPLSSKKRARDTDGTQPNLHLVRVYTCIHVYIHVSNIIIIFHCHIPLSEHALLLPHLWVHSCAPSGRKH